MKIYFDLILLENLLMNSLILFATGIVLKVKIKNYRLFLSSLIGSFYAIIVYLNIIDIVSNIFMKIILSISMVWIAYQSKNLKQLLKHLVMFYGISFIFGGCAFALIYFISPKNVKIRNGVLVGLYPLKVTIFAGVVAFIIIQIIFRITKSKLTTKNMICDLEIFLNNNMIKIKAFIDSGNMLKDPISKCPVIIVNKDSIKNILSDQLLTMIEKIKGGDFEFYEGIEKIRLIPFSSLGNKNGMLIGIKADGIKISYENKTFYRKDIIIGISEQEIGIRNKYKALIGLELFEGSEKDEYITTAKV